MPQVLRCYRMIPRSRIHFETELTPATMPSIPIVAVNLMNKEFSLM